ncbi:MAG: AraC-like DNA-binding protein [Flavobacteriales bacterium]|jgi:AraC-like DNA-binding protein
MQNFFLILTGMAFGAILLVVCKLMLEYRKVLTAKVLSLMLLSAGCYMVQPFVHDMFYLQLLLGVGAMANPALFWMFASTLFQMGEKNQTHHLGHYIGLITCITLSVYQCLQSPADLDDSIVHIFSLIVTSTLTVLGLFDVFRNWQSDLVECRRLLRLGLSVTSGAFLLFVVVNEFIYGQGEFPAFLNYLNIIVISIFAMAFGYIILVSDSNILMETMDELTPELVKSEIIKPTSADSQWIKKLTSSMEDEFYYRQVDVTIKSLSEYLTIPEHQLRRLINQHLGYRNFNDYLNRYRVRDAAQRLSDPKLIRLPILTIAIESGYASLTTFNKAFKTLKTMTPSEFRKISGLSDSPELTDF